MTKKTEYRNPLMNTPVESVTILHFHKGKNGRTYLVDPMRATKNCRDGRCLLASAANMTVLKDYALAEGQVFLAGKKDVKDVAPALKGMKKIAEAHGIPFALGFE